MEDVITSKPYVFFIDSGHDIVKGWDVEDNADYDNYYYRLGLSLFYPTSNYYPPLAEDEGI